MDWICMSPVGRFCGFSDQEGDSATVVAMREGKILKCKLDRIPDTTLLTAIDPKLDVKNEDLYTSFLAKHKGVVRYIQHDFLVLITGKQYQVRKHLESNLKCWGAWCH